MGAIRKAASVRSPRSCDRTGEPQRRSGGGVIDALVASAGGVAVMGILNVTPDSFSDGGRFSDLKAAVGRGRQLVAEGAHVIDVGGESTRPGASAVPPREEIRRVVPVVQALRGEVGVVLSVDTTKAAVAEQALAAGATLVNDVSGGRADRQMLPRVAAGGAGIILMHRRGTPATMQRRPRYEDVVREVRHFLGLRAHRARCAGIERGSIAVDPGIGFGKNLGHNLALLARIDRIATLGYVVAIGVSRKSFLGAILDLPVEDRLEGSIAAALLAVLGGAQIVRVHDVAATVRGLRVAQAIRTAR